MKYVYLDWNVIQYMKHENVDKKGKEFKELVKELSKKYIFPYSEGHLRDLAVCNTEAYIKEDLAFIKQISNNYCLGLYNKKVFYQKNYIDIKQFFNETKKTVIEERAMIGKNNKIESNIETDYSYKIELNEVDKNNLLKPFIEKNNGVLDNKVFINFINEIYHNINNPDYYKKFRNEVYNMKKNYETTPNSIIDQKSNHFMKLLPFLNFIVDNNIENIKNNFNKTMISFLSINNKRILEELTIVDKLELAYSLLDYNQNFRDNINKKNKPSNMLNDMNHLYFALEAKYYITEDDMTYKKSKFICEVLNIKVKVLRMDEFINKF